MKMSKRIFELTHAAQRLAMEIGVSPSPLLDHAGCTEAMVALSTEVEKLAAVVAKRRPAGLEAFIATWEKATPVERVAVRDMINAHLELEARP